MLTCGFLHAQTKLVWGPKLGFNLAQHYGTKVTESDYKVSTDFRPGFIAGTFLDLQILPHFSLGYEVLYSQKGSKETITIFRIDEQGDGVMVALPKPAEMKVKYYLDYLELPILLKVKVLDSPRFSMSAITGTAMSLMLKGYRELKGTVYFADGDGFSAIPISAESKLDEVNMFDYSFVYGGAFILKTKLPISLEYRFTLGWDYLSLPTNPEFDPGSIPVELRNQTYSLILSTSF
jgi:hypothetical protein